MRGLAVFISDIRNCEWRLGRGGAWAGRGRAGGRRGLLCFGPGRPPLIRLPSDLPGALPFPLRRSELLAALSSRNGDAPRGAAGDAGGGGCRDRRLFDAGAGVICLCLPSVRCFLLPHGLICWGRAGEGVDAHRWSEAGVGGLVAGRGVHRGSPRPASGCRCSAAPQESSRPLQGRGELGLRWLCLRLA